MIPSVSSLSKRPIGLKRSSAILSIATNNLLLRSNQSSSLLLNFQNQHDNTATATSVTRSRFQKTALFHTTRTAALSIKHPEPFDTDIETVDLSYDAHLCPTSKEIAQLRDQNKPIPKELEEKAHTNKEPIIFLHGIFGSKSNTRTVSRALARDLDRDVYCLDLRNHGDSPHSPEHTYPSLAADVEAFIKKHNLGPSIIVGHSMGAKVAMAVALRPFGPDLVAGLVSVDNSPWSAALSSMFPKYVRALQEIERRKLTSTTDAYKILAKTEPDVTIQQFLLSNLKRASQLPEPALRDLKNKRRLAQQQEGDVPQGNHPHDHHPHRDGSGIVHDHSSSDLKKDKTLYFRVPLDIIGKSLSYMGDFPYLPFESRYTGPTLIVRGMKSP